MPVIDFHNHYYPPRYMDALQSGESSVRVTVDSDGNPNLHYPGDYNVAVRGHRDLAYREEVLDKHGVTMQVVTLTTPGTHVEEPATAVRLASLVNDEFKEAIETRGRHFTALATLPLNDPAASLKEFTRATGELGMRGAMLFSNVNGVALSDQRFWPIYEAANEMRRGAVHPPDAPGERRDDAGILADAAGRLPLRHDAGGGVAGVHRRRPSGSRTSSGRCATSAGRSRIWSSGSIAASTRSRTAARTSSARRARYLKEFYYDTVNFNQGALKLAIDFAGADHILAGSDYPHQIGSIPLMLEAIDKLPVTDDEREGIRWRNAARLLGIEAGRLR